MASFEPDTIEIKGLQQLCKALKARPPVARLGILGDKNKRKKGIPGNAEIGAAHEFGSEKRGLPQRSFLRVPLIDKLQGEMEKTGALEDLVIKEVIRSGSMVSWLKKIAVLGEKIVQDAFATGGFGKWKPSDMTRKKNHQTLVETQQLRDSIVSEVKE
jgi:phage gpG-like protein